MYNPLISIVIPVYNREMTLHYCVDSVLNQNYPNWELLLVDDGSIDKSAEICKDYESRDSRIRYFYQENQGAGPARNKGLDNAKGEWVTFIDSDDAIMPNHLDQVVSHGKGRDLVMVNHGKGNYVGDNLICHDIYWKDIPNAKIDGNIAIIEFLYDTLNPYKHYNYCCWDKFFYMEVIDSNHLRFPSDIPTGQDKYFVVSYFKYTQAFFFSKEGTHISTPQGNEGIEHLACKLRSPREFLHCHKRNFDVLMDLYQHIKCENVRNYAIHYFIIDTLERAMIRYTHWRERRIVGKNEILVFLRESFKPIVEPYRDMLWCVNDKLLSKQANLIIIGEEEKVYDYWFYKNLLIDLKMAIKRRLSLWK